MPAVAWTLEWVGRTGLRRIEPLVDPVHEQARVVHRETKHEAMVDAGAVPVEVGSAVDE